MRHLSCFNADFDNSLLRYGRDQYIFTVLTKKGRQGSGEILELCSLLKSLYNQPRKQRGAIPKIIHQIWLGGPPPKAYSAWMEAWRNLPGFEYRLWTDKEASEFPLKNRTLYNTTPNLAGKSDILRYEILYRYGGVYIDTDIECLSGESVIEACDTLTFFAGIEPFSQALDLWIGNSIFGVEKESPLIKEVMEHLPTLYPGPKVSPVYVTGPALFSREIKKVLRSGSVPEGTLIFPTTVFYPCTKNHFLTCSSDCGRKERNEETVAVHYYGKNWHADGAKGLDGKDATYPSFFHAISHKQSEKEFLKILTHPLHKGSITTNARLKTLNALYHRLEDAEDASEPIPKVIHQIETAPSSVDHLRFMVSWMGIQGFEYRLWDKAALIESFPKILSIPLEKRMDFAKFSILFKCGGLFAERSLFCFDETFFDRIVRQVSFFAGLEPLADSKELMISTLLMGATKSHPLMQKSLEGLIHKPINGLTALTEAFFSTSGPPLESVIFPPSFFYPFSLEELSALSKTQKTPNLPKETAALGGYVMPFKKRLLL